MSTKTRIEMFFARRGYDSIQGVEFEDVMTMIADQLETMESKLYAPTGAVRPLSHPENYCGRCELVDDHFEDCELHDPEAAPTKTLESLFNCAEPVDFEEIIALCKECSACECGAEAARCGGHSAWCPKA